MRRRLRAPIVLAGLTAILSSPAFASGVVDNVNGIALDANGGIVRFGAMLIDDEGKVAQLFPGRYQEPPRKKPKRGESWPKGHDFKLDAGGKTMIPGLIDGHGRIMGLGLSFITLDLSDTRSLAEAQAKIRAYAQENGGRKWIVGRGWDEARWGLGRALTAADLDTAVSDVPVWLERADGNAGWANSAALRAAGAGNAAKGRAGLFVGDAMEAIRRVVPAPAPKDRDIALEKAQRALLAAGITTVADMGTTIDDWQAYRRSADRGALRVRILAYAAGLPDMVMIAGPEPTPWLYDDRLRLGGVQFVLDGSLTSRGAWLKADYADAAGQRGRPLIPDTQLRNMMSRAAMDNFQIAIDASGDAAASEALDAIQELSETYTGDRRWRIERTRVVAPADLPRFGRFGIVASMQPVELAADWRIAAARLGDARTSSAYAWKAMRDNRVPLAFGTDMPAGDTNPFAGIATAMSREDAQGQPGGGWMPEQRVGFEAALDAFTRTAAFAGSADKRFGSLIVGQRADFLLVDRDVSTARAADIRTTQVLETWIGGKRVYAKGQ